MLEEKDIQKIGEEMGKVIEQNITPVLDEMNQKFDKLDKRVGKIEAEMVTKDEFNNEIGKIEAEMVTKAYLDDKLSDFADNLDAKRRKDDGKVNRLIGILKDKSIINEKYAMQLKDSQAITQ